MSESQSLLAGGGSPAHETQEPGSFWWRARARLFQPMTPGERVVTTYFLVAYIGPLVGNLLFYEHIQSTYRLYPLTASALVFLVAVYVLFLIWGRVDWRLLPILRVPWLTARVARAGHLYMRWRLPIAFSVLTLAVVYAFAGFNRYRYLEQGISQTNSDLLLVFNVMRTAVTADLFYVMFLLPHTAAARFTRRYTENVLMSLALVVSSGGTASMFLALAALAYSVVPRAFQRVMFVTHSSWSWRRTTIGAATFLVLPLMFFVAWLVGETIKASSGGVGLSEAILQTADRLAHETFASGYVFYLVERFSIYYYSFLFSMSHSWSDLNTGTGWILSVPLQGLSFRLDYLLGGIRDVARPDVGSISVLNYRLLAIEPVNLREGSSPGLLASFNYVFPFPLNLMLCSAFLAGVAKVMSVLAGWDETTNLSPIGALVFLAFTLGVFQSPFDLLLVFDEVVVYLGILFGIYWVRTRRPNLESTRSMLQARS